MRALLLGIMTVCALPAIAHARDRWLAQYRVELATGRVTDLGVVRRGPQALGSGPYGDRYRHEPPWLVLEDVRVPISGEGRIEWVHRRGDVAIVAHRFRPPGAQYDQHRVRAVRVPDGAVLWGRADLSWWDAPIIAAIDGDRFAIAGDAGVHVVALADGRGATVRTRGRAAAFVSGDRGLAYVATEVALYAIRIADGAIVWELDGIWGGPVQIGGELYAARIAGDRHAHALELLALDPDRGAVRRTIAIARSTELYDHVRVALALDGGRHVSVRAEYTVLD